MQTTHTPGAARPCIVVNHPAGRSITIPITITMRVRVRGLYNAIQYSTSTVQHHTMEGPEKVQGSTAPGNGRTHN